MTYNVFGWTLNLTQSIDQHCALTEDRLQFANLLSDGFVGLNYWSC